MKLSKQEFMKMYINDMYKKKLKQRQDYIIANDYKQKNIIKRGNY